MSPNLPEYAQSYRQYLDEALAQNFPELEPHFATKKTDAIESEPPHINGVVSEEVQPTTNGNPS
jgi:hypothetical protein